MKEKIVYVGMAADRIHAGHIYLLNEASKYGKVIVGVLTDEAIATYKRVPLSTWEERKKIVESLKMVHKVIPQDTLDYIPNIRKIRPDYVIHGDDWKTGIQKEIRDAVEKELSEWNGKVIDVKRIDTPSTTDLIEHELYNGVTTEYRRKQLRRLLEIKPYIRVIEAHDGLSGIIADTTNIINGDEKREFDAIWISSLADSVSKGKPDIEIVDFTSRIQTINEILEVTRKPLIVDVDTGGLSEHLSYMIKTLERLGVSGIIIEDKKYPKRNSLLKNAKHVQEEINSFVEKLKIGLNSRITQDFMIIARIESLIAGKDVKDALDRAISYINAGVDGIMIHSKEKTPKKLIKFCEEYKKIKNKVPLVLVPTSYNNYTEEELVNYGANIIIYANQLIRASLKSMKETAKTILEKKTCNEKYLNIASIDEILEISR